MKSVRALTRFAFFVLAVLLPGRVFCEATMQQILTNGPTDKRINIVVLSEGYTTADLERFPIDAERYLNHLLATPPFDEYRSYFNGFIISVASAESGSDHPEQSEYRDTYFNSSYGTGDSVRLLSIPYGASGRGKVDGLLREFIPGYDLPILLVNDAEWGGAGGTTTIVSRNSLAADAAVHELGHTLAHLDDEYSSSWSGADSAERANSTQETRPQFIKWHRWIDDSTPIPTPETSDFEKEVGLFEGAHYHDTGWYRPRYNCKMNTIGAPFCEVCLEALVLSFYDHLNPIDAFSPPNPAVTVANEPVALSVKPLQPETHALEIQWFIDKSPVSGATSNVFVLSAESLAPGTYDVVAEVRDATPLVRADPWKQLIDSHSWSVTVLGEPPKAPTPLPMPDLVAVQDSNGDFVINLTGPLGSAYVVQTTSDFVTWETLVTVTNITGRIQIFDPAARQQSLRFYRAVPK